MPVAVIVPAAAASLVVFSLCTRTDRAAGGW